MIMKACLDLNYTRIYIKLTQDLETVRRAV